MAIKKRGKTLSLYRRVPKRYASIESRKFIWLALHTDSPSTAERKAGPAWDALIAAWEAKLAGDTSDAEQRFAAARELAAARGFRYLRADQVAKLPRDELLDRIPLRDESISRVCTGPETPSLQVKTPIPAFHVNQTERKSHILLT